MKKLLSVILVCAMILSVFALPAMAENEADNRIWFDLNGNSRFFVKEGDGIYENRLSYTNYLPGVDFVGFVKAPTGDFKTDQAAVVSPINGGGMFLYKIGTPKDTDSRYATTVFTEETDGSIYWTINGVKYRVNPNENVIKTCKNAIDTSALTDADMIARYESVNKEAVIDVEDGRYKNVGLLVTSVSGAKRNATVSLVYTDETVEEGIYVDPPKIAEGLSYRTGSFFTKNFMLSNDNSNGTHGAIPFTIETNSSKTLTAIKIKDATNSSVGSCLYVISAWGEKFGTSDMISAVEEMMADGIGDVDEYKAIKTYMDLIGEENLTEEQKAVYNNALSALASFEANLEEIEKEAARQEAMTKRTYNYLTLAADRDLFATWKDVTDLSRFYYDATGTVNTAPAGFNTATYDCDGTTIFAWIPHDRADGTKVTGQETFYFKGLRNVSLPQLPEDGNAPAAAPYVYLLDDITEENGTSVAGRRVNGLASSGDKAKYGSDEYYTGANDVKRATSDTKKTVTNPEFVQKLDENGYFIIKEKAGSETFYKLGPVSKDGYSPNAQITGSSIYDVNVKGTTLDILLTVANINCNTTYFKSANSAVKATPVAALQQVTITYEDGEIDTKYIVATDNKLATYNASYSENAVIKTIVFASKYDSQGNEIKYDGNSFYANKDNYDFKVLKGNLETVGLAETVSADAVRFENPDIIMAANTRVAQLVNLRQDAMHNNYGAFSSSASLPLENKKIESIKFPVNQSAALNDPSAIAVIDNAKDVSKSTVALLPVEIEGASDQYVYFAYVGRITSDSYLLAATVTEHSSNEKIAAAEEAMSKITVESSMEEAKEALKLYNIAKEDKYLKDSDFDSALVEAFMNTYTAIRENIKLSGKITVRYYNGAKPSADVEMNNYAELAGKKYQVILAYYDEKGICVGKDIFDKETTEAEKETYTLTGDNCPENVVKVKGFIWNGLDKISPLANPDETEKKNEFKILSIGNSFSENAHEYLGEIAQSAGFEKVIIYNLFKGGCTLDTHYDYLSKETAGYTLQYKELVDGKINRTSKANVTMLEGILAEDWDVITIQQGSSHSGKAEKFTRLQEIVDYVNANKTNKNAKIVWHQTWSYKDDSDNLHNAYPGMTQMDMYNAIVSAVKTQVIPLEDIDYVISAGTAVQNARVPLGDTMNSDNIHLNEVGEYLIGLVWFEKITGISLDAITYVPENATIKDNLAALKKAAKDAIANPYEVTK